MGGATAVIGNNDGAQPGTMLREERATIYNEEVTVFAGRDYSWLRGSTKLLASNHGRSRGRRANVTNNQVGMQESSCKDAVVQNT